MFKTTQTQQQINQPLAVTITPRSRTSIRTVSILLLGGLFSSLMASCFESKVSQCNQFVAVVNKETSFVTAFHAEQTQLQPAVQEGDQTAMGQTVQSLRTYSKHLDTLVEEANALELEDTVVDGLRQQYVTQQGKYSQEIQTLADAIETLTQPDLDLVELKRNEGKIKGTQLVMEQLQENISILRDDYAAHCTNGFQPEDFAEQ